MDVQLQEKDGVRLAIEGCGHGTLHAIYASVGEACRRKGWPDVDLLIIGGDFQSVRNAYDLNCVSMPAKYRAMCDFHEYYSGQRQAPCLTIFVGGNHEASNYLFELYYGGWVAPNIYYMGATNVLRFGPLRIAGLSGIWKGYNYRKPHHERLPYSENDLKSVYHVREMDVRKLLQVRSQVDIGISHDWPKGVEWKGNWKQLFRIKKFFEEDARSGQLGSVAAQQVMEWLRPKQWFSAHLHCKFAAVVEHGQKSEPLQSLDETDGSGIAPNDDEVALDDEVKDQSGIIKNDDELALDLEEDSGSSAQNGDGVPVPNPVNSDEIDLELDSDTDNVAPVAPRQGLDGVQMPVQSSDVSVPSIQEARAALPAAFNRPAPLPSQPQQYHPAEHPTAISNPTTNFLALDKCMPNRHFLQLLAIPSPPGAGPTIESRRPLELEYDREWLAITRAFALHEPPILGDPYARVPPARTQGEYSKLIDEQLTWIDSNMAVENALIVPDNFEVTAPVYDGGNWLLPQYSQANEYPNSQTARFCEMLQVPNAFAISDEELKARMATGPREEPENERLGGNGRGRGGFGRGKGRGGFDRGRGRGRGWGRGRGGFRPRG